MLNDIQPITRSHPQRRAAAQSTRERLVQTGLHKVLESGWAATGIDVVLRECGVPKGSFYHYFSSKEAFGFALLDSYQAFFMRRLTKWFAQHPTDNLESLSAAMEGFLADSVTGMERYGYRRGCLLGALGQEVASLHDGFRAKLLENLQEWEKTLASALFDCASSYQKRSDETGIKAKPTSLVQDAGRPLTVADCDQWAQEFWAAWEGAVLRSLLAQNADALHAAVHRFMQQFALRLAQAGGLTGADNALLATLKGAQHGAQYGPVKPSKKKTKPVKKSENLNPINDIQTNLDF
jgi:TetR/AcrR family transcriptional regulator, transcriptional repressor for nem operon